MLQWSPKDSVAAPISSAIYSCDSMLVYAGFCDGGVGVFDADSLRLRCRISPSAYIPPSMRYDTLQCHHYFPPLICPYISFFIYSVGSGYGSDMVFCK